MNEAFVEINGVPTKVMTWGRWIEESQGTTNEIIIVIPGNPGIPGFYTQFCEHLYKKTEIPVWCVGHAGHNFSEQTITKMPKLQDHKDLYGLKGQIDHKVAFFQKYVPDNAQVHLVAHSIGSYMTLEIIEHPDIKPKVKKAYLLFPTIEHMATTKNGRFLTTYVRPIVWLLLLLTWIFTLLPNVFANLVLYIYTFLANIPYNLHAQNIKELLKPGVLIRVFFLAFKEMDQVKERNNAVIRRNVDKLKFYYGRTDGWAPEQFCSNIRADCNVSAELTDIKHAFVFNNGIDVASHLSSWINSGL